METKSSTYQRSPIANKCCPTCYAKIGILFVLGIFVFVIHQAYSSGMSYATSELPYYTVVLDCGSTGTRINIYEWLKTHAKNRNELVLSRSFPDYGNGSVLLRHSCQYHCMQTEPGLDKVDYNFSALTSALEPLFIWAEKNIPSDRHIYTPIFILGTAGLRKLPVWESDWIMTNAENIAKRHQFVYKQSWIRVLSGEEEAYYAWVALNYKLGRLGKFLKNTVGILDLGGSSMQVAWEMEKPKELQHYFKSKIGFAEHGLLTYSLAGLGLNDAFDRSITLLTQDPQAKRWMNGMYELRHPCLNKGFMKNHTCFNCSKHWKTESQQNAGNESFTSQPPIFSLVGYPNWIKCKALARGASVFMNSSDNIQLSRNMNCNNSSLISRDAGTIGGLKSISRHSNPVHFHALSGFSIVYSTIIKYSNTNLTEFLRLGEQLCSRTWKDVERLSGNKKYAEQSCFRIAYIVSLLKNTMCLTDADISFGPSDISWTLGAALIEGELLQFTENRGLIEEFISKNTKALSFFLFLLAMVLSVCVVTTCRRFKRIVLHFLPPRRGVCSEIPLTSFFFPKEQVH